MVCGEFAKDDERRLKGYEIYPLKDVHRHFAELVSIHVSAASLEDSKLNQLREILSRHPGDTPVQICLQFPTGEKVFVPLEGVEDSVTQLLKDVHDNLYAMAEKNLEDNTFDLTTWEEVRDMAQGRGGFARTKWCGSLECELAMKEKAGVSSRCMPLKQSGTVGKCPVCGTNLNRILGKA